MQRHWIVLNYRFGEVGREPYAGIAKVFFLTGHGQHPPGTSFLGGYIFRSGRGRDHGFILAPKKATWFTSSVRVSLRRRQAFCRHTRQIHYFTSVINGARLICCWSSSLAAVAPTLARTFPEKGSDLSRLRVQTLPGMLERGETEGEKEKK